MLLDIITQCPVQNPAIVGEDNPIVSQIPFAEAVVDVVLCAWAVPNHPRTSIKMALLLWARACRGGDGGSGVALGWQGGILLWQRGGILARRGGILLQWAAYCCAGV
jgi:hypothetical protein